MKVKIGIVGLGYTIGIAKNHIKSYLNNDNCQIVALYDIVEGRTQEWLKKNEIEIEGVKHCKSYDELLTMVDGVSICTPNDTHEELSIKALETGVHVLCEKPISHTLDSAVRMCNAAKKHPDVINMIGFCYRGIPAVRYMKSMIDEGKLGKVFGFRHCLGGARIANPTGVELEWRMRYELAGTGAMADFGSHMLDLTEYLLGATEGKIEEVSAFKATSIKDRKVIDGSKKAPVTNDDTSTFMVKMQGGAVGTFYSSRVGMNGQYFEIFGEGGMMAYLNEPEKVYIRLKDKNAGYDEEAKTVDVPAEFIDGDKFQHEINEFVYSIANNVQPDRDFETGLHIQRVLEALSQSGDTSSVKKSEW